MDMLNKIFSFVETSNQQKSSFENLKKDRSILLLFSAIEDYSQSSEIRYVGGCIRQILNNETIQDFDFAVNIQPNECIEALKKHNIKFYETGIEHGTITAIINNNKFEITSLRKDITTDGRHAKVKFSNNWFEDAARRDFTINSIYSDIDGNLYDPFNGKKAIELGKVEFIGDIEKRIKEDYLRILRYIRFFLNYSKQEHSEKVKKIIKQNINGIASISSERILDEFKKIIQSKGFLNLFNDPFSEEIILLFFPQFKNIRIFRKLNSFAKKRISEFDHIFLISLMIIDETDNVDYFLFKFNISNAEKERILFLKKFYNQKINKNSFSKKNLWKILYHNGKKSVQDLLNFEIFRSKNINKNLIDLVHFFKDKEVPVFPIRAKNLMERYNLSEGKLLGIKLKEIEEKWIENDFKISEREINKLIEN